MTMRYRDTLPLWVHYQSPGHYTADVGVNTWAIKRLPHSVWEAVEDDSGRSFRRPSLLDITVELNERRLELR